MNASAGVGVALSLVLFLAGLLLVFGFHGARDETL